MATTPAENPTDRRASARQWYALAVLAGIQLLIVLDATIVNVILTEIDTDLSLGPAGLHWVITGYVLTFGGFLLLGGRLADRFGRRRSFVIGAVGFALGSLLAGFAQSASELIAGRAVQGAAAALLAPACLSLLMVVFPAGPGRNRALAVWGAVSASGMTAGLLLGGLLSQAFAWQWVFWVNVPIAAGAVLAARAALPPGRTDRREPFDTAGALLGTSGLFGLGYGLVGAAGGGDDQYWALVALVAGAGLLAGFARLQLVRTHSLLPTRLLASRPLLGANLVALILGGAVYSLFYFLSLFFGQILGHGPIGIGLAFLPMTATIAAAASVAGRLLPRRGPRPLLIAATLLLSMALASLARINPDSHYLTTVLPALLVAGAGLGLAFVALTTAAVGSAPTADSGVAAGVFNAAQQIGGALGLVILTAVTTARGRGLTPIEQAAAGPAALTQGWALGFVVAAAGMAIALLVVVTMIRQGNCSYAGSVRNSS